MVEMKFIVERSDLDKEIMHNRRMLKIQLNNWKALKKIVKKYIKKNATL
jgi:hypothetical protein